MVICVNCGQAVPANARFCPNCGTNLAGFEPGGDTTTMIPAVAEVEVVTADLSAEEDTAVTALPTGSALLLVRRGASAGARFLLDKDEHTAGRNPTSDIFLDDITVSRNHVQFLRVGGEMVVRDVGSLNGTYVNRTLIDGDVVLQPGDEVRIGKFQMIYFPSPHGLGD